MTIQLNSRMKIQLNWLSKIVLLPRQLLNLIFVNLVITCARGTGKLQKIILISGSLKGAVR